MSRSLRELFPGVYILSSLYLHSITPPNLPAAPTFLSAFFPHRGAENPQSGFKLYKDNHFLSRANPGQREKAQFMAFWGKFVSGQVQTQGPLKPQLAEGFRSQNP